MRHIKRPIDFFVVILGEAHYGEADGQKATLLGLPAGAGLTKHINHIGGDCGRRIDVVFRERDSR